MNKNRILKKDLRIEKKIIRRYFYIVSISLVILLALVLSLNYTHSLDEEYSHKINQLSSSILNEKKRFLRNTIERTVYYIEQERKRIRKENVSTDLTAEQIEAICVDKISRYLREMRLIDNGYIWVNRIIDYNGGDDYAIRQIHPNLPHTEGMWLSTNMMDIKGNRPYEAELNGMKKDGELYFEYYFKKIDSEKIVHKMSFAKLYKPYDWVVATGVYLDDVDSIIDNETRRMQKSHATQKFRSLFVTLFFVVVAILIIIFFEGQLSRLILDYEKRIKTQMDSILEEKAKVEKVLSEVKELKGMLPICSKCKKIRDDQGYWKHIESYIKHHTDVDFSHGLCPECLESLYGEQEWYKKAKRKGKF